MVLIKDYKIPKINDVSPNKVSWEIDNNNVALLVHDMQLYFLKFFAPKSKVCESLLNNIEALINTANEKGIKIIYTAQPGNMDKERGLLLDIWGPGMSKNPNEQKIHSLIAPQQGDTILTKWRYSAFHNTELENFLINSKISQLIITGVFAHIGCLVSAIDAYSRDIKVFFPIDAVADFDRERHIMAASYAAANCATVSNTKTIINSLTNITTIKV